MITIGVISDTHGLLREEALSALEGSDLIIHAGDVGAADILQRLELMAPVHVVRGNTDGGALGASLPTTETVELKTPGAEGLSAVLAYVLHDMEELDLDPRAAGVSVVIHGHTHRPDISRQDDVLYFNCRRRP
jgi:putative phosphoesterase